MHRRIAMGSNFEQRILGAGNLVERWQCPDLAFLQDIRCRGYRFSHPADRGSGRPAIFVLK